ncbi:hypothetical protein FMEAI12_3220042 [Parafrankia sp. Ea1.12]|nr:hypothetical protein FMEAI12_3220042 [Parafrankia sp. Ea1.12]
MGPPRSRARHRRGRAVRRAEPGLRHPPRTGRPRPGLRGPRGLPALPPRRLSDRRRHQPRRGPLAGALILVARVLATGILVAGILVARVLATGILVARILVARKKRRLHALTRSVRAADVRTPRSPRSVEEHREPDTQPARRPRRRRP